MYYKRFHGRVIDKNISINELIKNRKFIKSLELNKLMILCCKKTIHPHKKKPSLAITSGNF